jgi:hypothetical protein
MLDAGSDKYLKFAKEDARHFQTPAKPKEGNGKRRIPKTRAYLKRGHKGVPLVVKSYSTIKRMLHNNMTDHLSELCKKAKYEYTEKPGMWDSLITNYDGKGKYLLIEVKSLSERSCIREAVGQLLDYLRFVPNRLMTETAVLLPEKPSSDCISFLDDVGVNYLWFTDKKLKAIKGNLRIKNLAAY